jgi:flavodoxin
MKAMIVYDSFFGNTEKIAQAIAQAIGKALGSPEEVEALRVGQVSPGRWAGMTLLIVGSPTRAFSATPATRKFLGSIPKGGLQGIKVAAFDTRIAVEDVDSRILPPLVKLFGYAAEPIAKRLLKKGGELALPAEGFFVEGSEGPLKEGELERAADWARQILAAH